MKFQNKTPANLELREQYLDFVAHEYAAEWFTMAPTYRTKIKLEEHIASALRKVLEAGC